MKALSLLWLLLPFSLLAQQSPKGKIVGKVMNTKNESLSGATIKVSGLTAGFQSGADGDFAISLPAGKTYSIVVSFAGYEAKTIDGLEVKAGENTNVDAVLDYKSTGTQDVVIKGKARVTRVESINSAIQFVRNTNTVAAVVSAEAIRRSPDRTSGDVLKRVPGASIQDGKYLVVRGLADRYNQTMLNGILMSSTEADRKTFSFDILPANMIENIIVNKAFVPELPGEWAGGLVQVNLKDIPASNFFNVQVGTGFNSRTIGKDFYRNPGGKYDLLGFDDGKRGVPAGFPLRADFQALQPYPAQRAQLGTLFANNWDVVKGSAQLNTSLQLGGGFTKNLSGAQKLAGVFGLTYQQNNRRLNYDNGIYNVSNAVDTFFSYNNDKYSQNVLWGALGNLTYQLNSRNKVSFKNLFNVNATDYVNLRNGFDTEFTYDGKPVNVSARELAFRSTVYYLTQLVGEHTMGAKSDWKLKWYGGFNILDMYVPDQRRMQYNQSQVGTNQPWILLLSSTLSQKSGSRFFQNLNDYIYSGGGDLAKSFTAFGNKQTIKGGYFFQVKDRLFDSRAFSMELEKDNPSLRLQAPSEVFKASNFAVNGDPTLLTIGEIGGNTYRYIANSILNAGYLQMDNEFGRKVRLVWGARIENFDQLVGSVKKSDPRFVNTKKTDILPGFNLTIKANSKSNIRLSASQTVIRPEFRELANAAFYDFEIGATVLGNADLKRTKVSNADLRYEFYPRAGETVSIGGFYKFFSNPIEQFLNQTGPATFTYNYVNAKEATSYGAEFEFRKKLDFASAFKNFTFQGNLAYIYNKVNFNDDKTQSRPMQGQSPYLVNLGLQYDLEKAGLTSNLLFNQIGRRILLVGGGDHLPAIWENPRSVLDWTISKKLLNKKAEIKLTIQDILNSPAYFYHDVKANNKFDKGFDPVAIKRNYGTNFGLSFAYNIK